MITGILILSCIVAGSIAAEVTAAPKASVTPLPQPTACLDGWTLYNGSCYKFFDYNQAKNHTRAEITCDKQHKNWWIHLASFEYQKEYEWAYEFLQKQPTFKVDMGTWVGITKDTHGVWKWATGVNVSKSAWADGQPNGNGVCGCIRRDTGKYNDFNCSAMRQYLCEYELSRLPPAATKLPSPCPEGWDYRDFSCYKFVGYDHGRSYSDAQKACNTLTVGTKTAHLANIQTADEYYYAYTYFEKQKNFHEEVGVWVGLRLVDSKWVWSDGTSMNYGEINLWAPDEPSDHGPCGGIHKETGGFSADQCDYVKQYFCEAELDRPKPAPAPTAGHACKTGWYHRDGSCYFFDGTPRTHDDAALNCTARHPDAALVNMETESEYEWINEEIAYRDGVEFDNENHGTWVGLKRFVGENKEVTWKWNNGKNLTYNNKWAKGNPSSDTDECVTIRRETSGLNDHGCDQLEQSVCEYEDEGFDSEIGDSSSHHKDIVILGIIVIIAVLIIAVALIVKGYRKYCYKNRNMTVKYSDMRTNQPEAYVDVRITENPRDTREYRDDDGTVPYTDKM